MVSKWKKGYKKAVVNKVLQWLSEQWYNYCPIEFVWFPVGPDSQERIFHKRRHNVVHQW